MEVSGTQSTSSTNVANSVNQTDLLNTDQFLKLFIAELSNQDPLEPMETSELTNQLAQLSMVEQLEHLSGSMDSLLAVQDSLAFYSGLIGKTGFWTDSEGTQMSGTIESIILREYEYYAIIGGSEVPVSEITQVSQEVSDSGSEL